MIQDIFPHKMHNEFRPDAVPGPDDLAMPWNGKAFLAAADFDAQSLAYPKVSDLKGSPDGLGIVAGMGLIAQNDIMNGLSGKQIPLLHGSDSHFRPFDNSVL